MKKNILAVLLSCALVLSSLSVPTYADENVNSIETTESISDEKAEAEADNDESEQMVGIEEGDSLDNDESVQMVGTEEGDSSDNDESVQVSGTEAGDSLDNDYCLEVASEEKDEICYEEEEKYYPIIYKMVDMKGNAFPSSGIEAEKINEFYIQWISGVVPGGNSAKFLVDEQNLQLMIGCSGITSDNIFYPTEVGLSTSMDTDGHSNSVHLDYSTNSGCGKTISFEKDVIDWGKYDEAAAILWTYFERKAADIQTEGKDVTIGLDKNHVLAGEEVNVTLTPNKGFIAPESISVEYKDWNNGESFTEYYPVEYSNGKYTARFTPQKYPNSTESQITISAAGVIKWNPISLTMDKTLELIPVSGINKNVVGEDVTYSISCGNAKFSIKEKDMDFSETEPYTVKYYRYTDKKYITITPVDGVYTIPEKGYKVDVGSKISVKGTDTYPVSFETSDKYTLCGDSKAIYGKNYIVSVGSDDTIKVTSLEATLTDSKGKIKRVTLLPYKENKIVLPDCYYIPAASLKLGKGTTVSINVKSSLVRHPVEFCLNTDAVDYTADSYATDGTNYVFTVTPQPGYKIDKVYYSVKGLTFGSGDNYVDTAVIKPNSKGQYTIPASSIKSSYGDVSVNVDTSVLDITKVTVKGAVSVLMDPENEDSKTLVLKQTTGATICYPITFEPTNLVDDNISVNIAPDAEGISSAEITKHENAKGEKSYTLDVTTNLNVATDYDKIIVSYEKVDETPGSIKSFGVQSSIAVMSQKPTVKAIVSDDISATLELSLPNAIKDVEDIYYQVIFTKTANKPDSPSMNDVVVKYIAADSKPTRKRIYLAETPERGMGEAQDYTVSVRLIQTDYEEILSSTSENALDIVPSPYIIYQADKSQTIGTATKTPKYETSLSLVATKNQLYQNVSNIEVAKVKWSGATTYMTLDESSLKVLRYESGKKLDWASATSSTDYGRIRVSLNDEKDGIVASSTPVPNEGYITSRAGKYIVRVSAIQGATANKKATSTFIFTVHPNESSIHISTASDNVYKGDSKKVITVKTSVSAADHAARAMKTPKVSYYVTDDDTGAPIPGITVSKKGVVTIGKKYDISKETRARITAKAVNHSNEDLYASCVITISNESMLDYLAVYDRNDNFLADSKGTSASSPAEIDPLLIKHLKFKYRSKNGSLQTVYGYETFYWSVTGAPVMMDRTGKGGDTLPTGKAGIIKVTMKANDGSKVTKKVYLKAPKKGYVCDVSVNGVDYESTIDKSTKKTTGPLTVTKSKLEVNQINNKITITPAKGRVIDEENSYVYFYEEKGGQLVTKSSLKYYNSYNNHLDGIRCVWCKVESGKNDAKTYYLNKRAADSFLSQDHTNVHYAVFELYDKEK